MNYREIVEKAQKSGKLRRVSKSIKTWEKEGDDICGKLLSFEEFKEGEFDQKCQSYVFDTVDGEISAVFGAVTDKTLAKEDNINHIFLITYKGKKETKNGQRFNDFEVEKVEDK